MQAGANYAYGSSTISASMARAGARQTAWLLAVAWHATCLLHALQDAS